jgi:hypothetical protein
VVKRAAVVLVAGFTIYLVFPAITEVLASWPRLSTLHPWWFTLAIGAEILCLLAALRATGARPRPSLILVAYAVAASSG